MRPLNMAVMRRGDVNRVDIIARNQSIVGGNRFTAMFGTKGFCVCQFAACSRDQNTAMAVLQITCELSGYIAGGENAPANFIGQCELLLTPGDLNFHVGIAVNEVRFQAHRLFNQFDFFKLLEDLLPQNTQLQFSDT